ncbi:hypothetical protein BpHYR1_016521 [Brachionus plicatilis]|uniref:Uncharacterized protein n=1 Tax=Brachionus plicatilis TaxID=10195 RepID=A0A3M7R7F4_BRAPC|nr:hypothetical protein BpHYR1_016521 [Brachionus plicatilis]
MAFLSCLWNSRCVYIPEFTLLDCVDNKPISNNNITRFYLISSFYLDFVIIGSWILIRNIEDLVI